jgi:hypothetical protein
MQCATVCPLPHSKTTAPVRGARHVDVPVGLDSATAATSAASWAGPSVDSWVGAKAVDSAVAMAASRVVDSAVWSGSTTAALTAASSAASKDATTAADSADARVATMGGSMAASRVTTTAASLDCRWAASMAACSVVY